MKFKCKMCGEEIPDPRQVELEQNICVLCLDNLVDDVDEGGATPDEFAEADLMNKEMRFDVR